MPFKDTSPASRARPTGQARCALHGVRQGQRRTPGARSRPTLRRRASEPRAGSDLRRVLVRGPKGRVPCPVRRPRAKRRCRQPQPRQPRSRPLPSCRARSSVATRGDRQSGSMRPSGGQAHSRLSRRQGGGVRRPGRRSGPHGAVGREPLSRVAKARWPKYARGALPTALPFSPGRRLVEQPALRAADCPLLGRPGI
jgi:hypothetical protein